jgi:hypothetical protein
MAVGYDASAHVRGPLANLQTIPRVTAVTGLPAPAPPEGRNYSIAMGFGDRNFTVGMRVHGNNISGSTLDLASGPQYMSGAAAIDARWTFFRIKGLATAATLAPSYTLLVDTTSAQKYWGNGIRYGAGISYQISAVSVFADAYQERLMFQDGPATGNSTRTGLTIGMAFQP